MAATLVREPFHRPGWVYEEKYDGWRMLAFKDGVRVRLISRQGVDHTARFRELAAAIAKLWAPELVLDAELCVFDEDLVSHGFTRGTVAELFERSRRLVRGTSPFTTAPDRVAVWLEPELLTEISYSELMDGWLRDPA